MPRPFPSPGPAGAAGAPGLAPSGTGVVRTKLGVLDPNPVTLGAARTFLRVNEAGTDLEDVEQNPYLVPQTNFVGVSTSTYHSRVVPENTAWNIQVELLLATENASEVGLIHLQALVRRATGGNVTLDDGPNTDGPDYIPPLPAALNGTTAVIDVDVASQSWRIRVTSVIGPAPAYTRVRGLVKLLPMLLA